MKNSKDFSKSFYLTTFAALGIAIFVVFKYLPSTRYQIFVGTGTSMEPTFLSGDELVVDTKAFPGQGDAIIFDCFACGENDSVATLTKRIHAIDQNGCYWLMGDNKDISYDSRSAGWLCPDDNIKVHGVVVDIKNR